MADDLETLSKQLAEKAEFVFDEEDAQRALEAFKSKGDTIDRSGFEHVFSELLGEAFEYSRAVNNSFYLDRLFDFCDTEKSGKITPKQFITQIGIAYSGEDADSARFNFAVYDVKRSGTVSRTDFLSVLKNFLKAFVEETVKELERDPSTAQKAQNLKKITSEINGKTGEKVLMELVDRAFNEAGGGDSLNYEKFEKGFFANYEHFAWEKLIREAMENLEEILHIED
jgi:Ca2+-binding EF-hand superfamily protein